MVMAHGGGINGFSTLISRMLEEKHLIVLFNNTGGARLEEIGRNIRGILYDKPYLDFIHLENVKVQSKL